MARTHEDSRNKLWKKKDNGTKFDMLVTHREYLTSHAAKFGVLALQRHGWDITTYPMAGDYRVVAMKKV